MTTTIKQIENWAEAELKVAEAKVEADFVIAKPFLLALGKTILSQVEVAGVAYLTGGATAAEAIASVTSQLPEEFKNLEGAVAAAFGIHVTNASAT